MAQLLIAAQRTGCTTHGIRKCCEYECSEPGLLFGYMWMAHSAVDLTGDVVCGSFKHSSCNTVLPAQLRAGGLLVGRESQNVRD